jgi:8-oxo-dGTP pyrophosphatase MutT (NUDIX family)
VSDLPFRRSCRGLLVDGDRVLLAQHRIRDGEAVWVGPGGGIEDGENLLQALTRELHEETGLVITADHAPRLVWVQTVAFPEMHELGYAGVANHRFVVHTEAFEPTSGVVAGAAGHPDGEGILDQRWWALDEIDAAHALGVLFSPRALPTLLRALLTDGPPETPIAIGL